MELCDFCGRKCEELIKEGEARICFICKLQQKGEKQRGYIVKQKKRHLLDRGIIIKGKEKIKFKIKE